MLATVTFGVVRGGHVAGDRSTNLRDARDAVANAAGFRITSIALAGQQATDAARKSSPPPASPAAPRSCSSTPPTARARLKANPWIAEATVLKLYPGRLHIAVTEREAFALWQKDGKVAVIAGDGTVLEPFVVAALRQAAAGGRRRRRNAGPRTSSRCSTAIRLVRDQVQRRGAGRRAALEPAAEERHRRAAAGGRRRDGARHAGRSSTATRSS